MKQVICLVFYGLLWSNVLAADSTIETTTRKVQQSGRIVGGSSVDIASFSHALSLRVDNAHTCGASVISVNFALTAGHCFPNVRNVAQVTLYGGSSNPYGGGGVVFNVDRIIIHPRYAAIGQVFMYDVALVRIRTSFAGLRNIAIAKLQDAEVVGGTRCHIVGWGCLRKRRVDEVVSTPSQLQYTPMNVVAGVTCMGGPLRTQEVICAALRPGVDVCAGDSGGGLLCNGAITGVASFATEDGSAPAAFAKVAGTEIRNFIRTNAGV